MTARLIEPTDPIDITYIPMLIFGPPGSWKTTLAQTADNPITLDFDNGIHRCANRKRAMRFDAWSECVEAGAKGMFNEYKTLVIDTGGRALDTMIPEILKENAKNGYAGNLAPQGWGVLGSRFTTWMKTVRSWGKDVVMLCHEDIGKDAAGNPDVAPDMPGKMSLKEMHKIFDIIGRIRYNGQQRVLDFSPCEGAICCKNAAGWDPMVLPDLHATANHNFLANLIADAKKRLGQLSLASAEVARAVSCFQTWLEKKPGLEDFNSGMTDLLELNGAAKKQAGALVMAYAEAHGWVYNTEKKTFVVKEAAK